jgi:signal peptidase II
VADQITKLIVKGIEIPALGISIQGMQYGVSKPVIGELFRLTYIENPGMAFGIDLGGKLYFTLFSILASVAIVVYLYRHRNERLGFRVSLAMILGGALGNLVDRVFYGVLFGDGLLFHGRVVDFFDLDFPDINIFGYALTRWPVFNIADASVTVGVLLLLLFQRPRVHGEAAEAVQTAPREIPSSSPVAPSPVAPSDAESQRPAQGSGS